jgi:hypothetical protein
MEWTSQTMGVSGSEVRVRASMALGLWRQRRVLHCCDTSAWGNVRVFSVRDLIWSCGSGGGVEVDL